MASSKDEELLMNLIHWRTERLEVANLSLIDRSSSLVGFVVIEFGLVAQILTITTLKFSIYSKGSLILGVILLLASLYFLLRSILAKQDTPTYYFNANFKGKTSKELIELLSKIPRGYLDTVNDSEKSWRRKLKKSVQDVRGKSTKTFDAKYNQEVIEHMENDRRAAPYRAGLISLEFAQLFIALTLILFLIQH